ncbi:glycosyl hydrolase family 28-related protein [Burkholderia multivorans]|uniref:Tail fiber n=1 Tax=Burkholderia multivorans CGD2 TaxID=513052 RepID=B9BX49_9BURK|nr:glycosyl hydrolase family 28-related protein [Burkholderia multivorans]EEE04559.1 tail fiber [Burkholderia multivorans CGD2]EEE11187.1 tail fiber [Burkholderia multivorans CGD2M]
MTVSTTKARDTYKGNGLSVDFPIDFYFLDNSHIKVSILHVDGSVTELFLDSDFSVTGAGNVMGGALRLATAPSSTDTIIVDRVIPATQETQYQQNDPFPAKATERALDKLTMLVQQQEVDVANSIKFPIGDFANSVLPRANERANRVMMFASDGSVRVSDTQLPAPDTMLADTWVVGTDFHAGDLSVQLKQPDLVKSVKFVFMDGAFQQPSSYSIGDGERLVFDAPIPDGVQTITAYYIGTVYQVVPVNGAISVLNFGCPTDGVSDCTAAVQKAIDAALAIGGRQRIYFPAGVYRFAATSPSLDPGYGNLAFIGDGMDSSILIGEEGTYTGGDFDQRKHLFCHTSDTVLKGSLEFSHLQFRGTLAENGYVEQGGAALALNFYRSIYIHHCRFYNRSWMAMANEGILSAQVQNNEFDTCMRDMCRFRSSFNCFVVNNTFRHGDDDAIALHHAYYFTGSGKVREGIVVDGNSLEDTCGIHILGARSTTVSNNVLRRVKQTIIAIDSDSLEGGNPMFAISVHNNQIFDSLVRPANLPNAQFACIGINYGGVFGAPKGNPAPMENAAGTQNFLAPYAFRDSFGTDATFPAMFGISVHNNHIQRTLPAVGTYSTWGFGKTFSVTGFIDPPVTDSDMRPYAGIVLQSDARAYNVHDNTVSGTGYGVLLDAPSRNFSSLSSRIHDNIFYDCIYGGVRVDSPGSLRNVQLSVSHNEFNLDPYCVAAARGPAGSWQTDSGPYGISGDGVTGIYFAGNVFSNCSAPVHGGYSAQWVGVGNVVRCQPSAANFSTSNKGVGNVPVPGARFFVDTFYSDPTQSNYQTPMNMSNFANESAGMPSAGYWIAGTFVRNTNPVGVAAYGWLRVTTGSGNAAGVDWKTVALS